jgi:hypothetical protein
MTCSILSDGEVNGPETDSFSAQSTTPTGVLAGYAWTKRGYTTWGATRKEYPEDPTPGIGLGRFPDLASAAAAVVANIKDGPRQ